MEQYDSVIHYCDAVLDTSSLPNVTALKVKMLAHRKIGQNEQALICARQVLDQEFSDRLALETQKEMEDSFQRIKEN